MSDDTMNETEVMEGQAGQSAGDFESWLAGQPDEVKRLAEAHIASHASGLKSALASERQQRKELAAQLREATGKLEKGSEAARTLEEISGRLDVAERRAAFYEAASRPEVGCTNARAAFLVAQAEGLFRKSGEVDWPALKEAAPELFGRRGVSGSVNAGAGTQGAPPASRGMNEFIRRASGVG